MSRSKEFLTKTETDMGEYQARLSGYARDAVEHLRCSREGSLLNPAESFGLALAFVGVDCPSVAGKTTLALSLADRETGKINYQAVFTSGDPKYREITPWKLHTGLESGLPLELEFKSENLLTLPVRIKLPEIKGHSITTEQTDYYCNQVGPKGEDLPVGMIINPKTSCAGACSGCARHGSFAEAGNGYISRHIEAVAKDYDDRFPGVGREELKSVNITTGCQPTAEDELVMMKEIIEAYRNYGFSKAAFHVFSWHFQDRESMLQLSEAGVVGYVDSMESFDDNVREKVWGRQKGKITFEEHLKRLQIARDIFPIVEASCVFGHEPFEKVKAGLETLRGIGVTAIGNVVRPYDFVGLSMVHPDVWGMGNSYFDALFSLARENNKDLTSISSLLRSAGLEYISRRDGVQYSDAQLPLKKM